MAAGIVAYGAHQVGKTHRVPGVLWVSTRFLHVMFFPFVPRSSWIFVHPATRADLRLTEDTFPIPLQPRSLLLAWVRALLVLVLLVGALVSVTKYLLARPFGDQLGASLFVVGPLVGLVLSYVLDRSSPEQLRELLTTANVPAPLLTRAMSQVGAANPR